MSSSDEKFTTSSPLKRRREPDDGDDPDIPEAVQKKKTKRRKRNKKVAGNNGFRDYDIEKGLDNAIGKMSSQLFADFLAQRTKRHSSDPPNMEPQDTYIPAIAFKDVSAWSPPRVLENLPQFLKENGRVQESSLSKASKSKGCPHTIVVTSAGIRAADMSRALRVFRNKEAAVMKLFGKHIKLHEAIEQVKHTRVGIGIGTPKRLIDLLDSGSLKTDALITIIIDGSHIDQKKRSIFDMQETHKPLIQLLTRPEIREKYRADSQGINILVY